MQAQDRWAFFQKIARNKLAIEGSNLMTTNDVFGAFIQAKEALDKLPAVEEENDRLKEDIQVERSTNEILRQRISLRDADIAALEARVKELTEQRDAAQLTELELRDNLESFMEVSRRAQRVLNPTQSAQPSQPEPSQPPVSGSSSEPQDAPREGQSDPRPTADETVASSQAASSLGSLNTDHHNLVKPVIPVSPKPYVGRPHWTKPEYLSWDEWADGGGEPPFWYNTTQA